MLAPKQMGEVETVGETVSVFAGMTTVTGLLCSLLQASFTVTVTVMFWATLVCAYSAPAAGLWLTKVIAPPQPSLLAATAAEERSGMVYLQFPAATGARLPAASSPIVGAVWSPPLTYCVFVSVLQPSEIVNVRVIFQLQLSVKVCSSVCSTVMVRLQLEEYMACTWASVFNREALLVE